MFYFGIGVMWLLSIGAILLTIGLAANAVWRAIMAPAGLARSASCGSCGYELGTMGAGRCSECGADLLKAGIMTRRNAIRLAGSLPAGLMGWTVICITLGAIAMGVASWVMMATNSGAMNANTNYTATQVFRPTSFYDNESEQMARSAPYKITFDLDITAAPMGAASSGTITATIEYNKQSSIIEFDPETEDWSLTGPDGSEIASGIAFSKSDAISAYEAVGLDPASNASLDLEAKQFLLLAAGAINEPWSFQYNTLAMAANQINADGDAPPGGLEYHSNVSSNNTMGVGMGMGSSPGEVILLLSVFGGGVLVWLIGTVLIVRRRGKIVRDPRPVAG